MTSVAAKLHFTRFHPLPYSQPFCAYCLTLPLHCLTDGSEERYQNTRIHRANHDEKDNGEATLAMQHQPGLAEKDMSCAPRGPCPVPVTVSFTFRCTDTLCLLVSWSGLVPPARSLLFRPPSNKIG
ncbi:hypothetical protein CPAR01_01006 [Colletotrichum paranaense]|uniref:Uncharacterized protein n=2 Tax=Colletotrichum acutatum species complex TaxID=2707335 RepID=A0AAI9UBU3_9PEZI|nr:uncharacterized protein CPAR01_01006 [Colletotrichum paranaense]KAK1455487.1 hypothetical protein CMEL01_04247 [Colletotrichum melonis]KAK1547039.1 hypothetical protein CPAR01_01006 [Colletotrichum paranaense]